jgi:hypothetical protein
MMHKSLLFLGLTSLSLGSMAQDAVDFSFTDVHGVEHNLFTELDAGKTIMLDFFFVNCGPCQYWSPSINYVYEQFGSGEGNVEFWSFTPYDDNAAVLGYESTYSIEFPSCSTEGGSLEVLDVYTSGTYGTFTGYPTYVIICPDRSVTWDVWPITENAPEVAAAIEACGVVGIEETGAKFVVNGLYPNPSDASSILSFGLENAGNVNIMIYDILGNQVGVQSFPSMPAGNHMTEIQTSHLAGGAYLLAFYLNGEQLHTSRLVVSH